MKRSTIIAIAVVGLFATMTCCVGLVTVWVIHSQPQDVSISDLIDNTAAYKGKTIRLVLSVSNDTFFNPNESLRENRDREVRFTTLGPHGEFLEIFIFIPISLAVPAATVFDPVIVTFVCAEGSLKNGNTAVSIERLKN